jgi:uracil-DNA glycosylase family 4
MTNIDALLDRIEAEARRAEFPIDREVYEKVGRDPLRPILCAGSFDARICSFGRDPGRDEVRLAQPQVGAAGRLVRGGVLAAAGVAPDPGDRQLEQALQHVFLTNTVPYKPPGNKAYPDRVKERFRPYVEELLLAYWHGDVVITLGTEAFMWFSGYADPGAADTFWKREDKYEAEFSCLLKSSSSDKSPDKALTICPLPHPSPLNQRWVGLFPDLLSRRLKKWL